MPIRWIWVVMAVATTVNAVIWWVRGRDTMAADPSRVAGYRRLIAGFVVGAVVPWLGLAVATFITDAPTVEQSMRGANATWREAACGVVGGQQLALFLWVYLLGGADKLVGHPGLFRVFGSPASALAIEVMAAFGVVLSIVVFTLAASGGFDHLAYHHQAAATVSRWRG